LLRTEPAPISWLNLLSSDSLLLNVRKNIGIYSTLYKAKISSNNVSDERISLIIDAIFAIIVSVVCQRPLPWIALHLRGGRYSRRRVRKFQRLRLSEFSGVLIPRDYVSAANSVLYKI
jgi:hypothetical protein